MVHTLLSTQEVAALINVTETTIKRWAGAGKIPCTKTLGGHRKFAMRDVVAFAEPNGFSLAGTTPPPMTKREMEQLELAVQTKNFKKISDIFLQEAQQADREGLLELLVYLYKHHITIPTIADEIIKPVFTRIGMLWQQGEIEIHNEHLASQAVADALVRFAPDLHRKSSNGLMAVCACVEGEYHEIGLRSLAFALETEGWKVHYIGANTPFETLQTFVNTTTPDLVCLSFAVVERKRIFLKHLQETQKRIKSIGGKFIVGGFGTSQYSTSDMYCDHVSSSVQDAISYAKDAFQLRPGPKRKQTVSGKKANG